MTDTLSAASSQQVRDKLYCTNDKLLLHYQVNKGLVKLSETESCIDDKTAEKLIAEQESALRFTSFTAQDAEAIGKLILSHVSSDINAGSAAAGTLARFSAADIKPVVIDISVHANRLCHKATEGATDDNESWIQRKRRTVLHFQQSSYRVGRALAAEKTSLSDKYGLVEAEHAAHGGCVPILLQSGECIGTVTVSGLAQVWDHILVVECMAQHLYP